jgi:excisionase family DNA binding protein
MLNHIKEGFMETLLVDVRTAASVLCLSQRAIRHLMRDGRLRTIRLGGRALLSREQIEEVAKAGIEGPIVPR